MIIAVVSLLSADSNSAFARRAYSYGSSMTGEAAANSARSSAASAAASKAITKDDFAAVVHKTPANAKKLAPRKHTDAHVDPVTIDEDSILNVFAPAPIDTRTAKVSHNKTNAKSVIVAGAKKSTDRVLPR